MLKKTIKYTDYNGVERTEDFYFNLSRPDVVKLQASETTGFAETLQAIVDARDNKEILARFEQIIKVSIGVRSEDGKRFIKSPALAEEFLQSEAYSELFVELLGNPHAFVDFVKGIMPVDLEKLPETLAAAEKTIVGEARIVDVSVSPSGTGEITKVTEVPPPGLGAGEKRPVSEFSVEELQEALKKLQTPGS